MKSLKALLIGAVVVAGIAGLVYLDFKIWRLQHPQAPTWTFFLRK